MSRVDQVRAALGPTPVFAAREVLPLAADAMTVALRYEWVKDWAAVAGLDFLDGAEWITFITKESYYES